MRLQAAGVEGKWCFQEGTSPGLQVRGERLERIRWIQWRVFIEIKGERERRGRRRRSKGKSSRRRRRRKRKRGWKRKRRRRKRRGKRRRKYLNELNIGNRKEGGREKK